MNANLTRLILSNNIFSSLDEKARAALLPKFTEVKLNQNEILFYQGDASDSVYLLIHGKLAAEILSATGEARLVGYILAGETVGELGALSHEPRSLTVKAVQNSHLVRLSAKDFVELCQQHASVIFATMHPIITRSTSILQMLSAEKTRKHIMIIAANNMVSLQAFTDTMTQYAKKWNSLLLISDYTDDFTGVEQARQRMNEIIQERLGRKKSSRQIVYLVKSSETPLAKLAFKRADVIYIAGDSRATHKIDQPLLDKIKSKRLHLKAGLI